MLASGQVPPPRIPSPRGDSYRRPFIGSPTRPILGSSTDIMASTTLGGMPADIRQRIDQRRNELKDLNNSSSTVKELRVDTFKIQQGNIADQLNRALNNLKQVRGRIQDRITESTQSGKDMTAAQALLAIADTKITIAGTAIATFVAYNPTTTSIASSTASTTTDIQLDRPRQVAGSAIAAIKDAKNSLNDVVTAIAQSLGVDLSQ